MSTSFGDADPVDGKEYGTLLSTYDRLGNSSTPIMPPLELVNVALMIFAVFDAVNRVCLASRLDCKLEIFAIVCWWFAFAFASNSFCSPVTSEMRCWWAAKADWVTKLFTRTVSDQVRVSCFASNSVWRFVTSLMECTCKALAFSLSKASVTDLV